MPKIVDTNVDTAPHLAALRSAGVETVFRYFNRLNPHGEKTVKAAEARAIAQAGMRLGIVYEGKGSTPGAFNESSGYADAKWSREYAATELRMPPDAAIYFAVDFDATDEQIQAEIIPYFQGIKSAMADSSAHPSYRIGVYGSGAVCAAVTTAGLAELIWLTCSSGWRLTRDLHAQHRWNMLQHVPANTGGIDTDPDEANGEIGDFMPFGATPAAPAGGQPMPIYPVPESISLPALNGVRSNEGRALRAYQDEVGVWTVGYGLTNYDKGLPWKIEKGLTITEEQAEWYLLKSLKTNYEPDVRIAIDLMKVEHPQGALDAGMDFHFNTGGIRKASWPKYLNAGRRDVAKQSLMSWNKAGGKVLNGLTRRRQWDCDVLDEVYGHTSGPQVIEPGADDRERARGTGDILTEFPRAPDDRSGGDIKTEGLPSAPKTYPPGMLRIGAAGPAVSELQTDLTTIGFPTPVTGTFDDVTKASVVKFQQTHSNLTADGIAGPATLAAIERAKQLRETTKTVAKTAGPAIPTVYIGLHQWASAHAANVVGGLALAAVAAIAVYLVLHYRHDIGAMINKWRGRVVL